MVYMVALPCILLESFKEQKWEPSISPLDRIHGQKCWKYGDVCGLPLRKLLTTDTGREPRQLLIIMKNGLSGRPGVRRRNRNPILLKSRHERFIDIRIGNIYADHRDM